MYVEVLTPGKIKYPLWWHNLTSGVHIFADAVYDGERQTQG